MKHVYISPLGMQDPWSGWNPIDKNHKPFEGIFGSSLALLNEEILKIVEGNLNAFKIILLVSDEIRETGGLATYETLVKKEFPQLDWKTHFEIHSITGDKVHLEATIRDDIVKTLNDIYNQYPEAKFFVNQSSGTPAMKELMKHLPFLGMLGSIAKESKQVTVFQVEFNHQTQKQTIKELKNFDSFITHAHSLRSLLLRGYFKQTRKMFEDMENNFEGFESIKNTLDILIELQSYGYQEVEIKRLNSGFSILDSKLKEDRKALAVGFLYSTFLLEYEGGQTNDILIAGQNLLEYVLTRSLESCRYYSFSKSKQTPFFDWINLDLSQDELDQAFGGNSPFKRPHEKCWLSYVQALTLQKTRLKTLQIEEKLLESLKEYGNNRNSIAHYSTKKINLNLEQYKIDIESLIRLYLQSEEAYRIATTNWLILLLEEVLEPLNLEWLVQKRAIPHRELVEA